MRRFLLPLTLLTLLPLLSPAAPAAEPVAITVAPGARQTFQGFGISLANWNNAYGRITQPQRDELCTAIWRDLKFNTLRLWMQTFDFAPAPGERKLDVFRKQYLESGIIADAKRFGVKHFLLAPDNLPEYMKLKDADGRVSLKPGEEGSYAVLLADAVQELIHAGVPINATGIQNEASDECRFAPEQSATVVKQLRKELNARGLADIKIVATENASANEIFAKEVDVLKADRDAWAALSGIASHSYNMAANDEIAKKIAREDGSSEKEYWMTEASENGVENEGDIFRAASLSARFLNDMNHRVTHWIHFLGYEIENGRDDATAIIKYTIDPFKPTKLLKYHTYKQLSDAFDVGARFRDSTSSLEGDMVWTYGQKPRLVVAAAQNPDGSWAIGLVNFTADSFPGVQGWADEKWNREQGGHTPAQVFEVTIDLPELRDAAEQAFAVRRTNATQANASDGVVRMKSGRMTVRISPLEVITLRSAKPQ